MNRLDEAVTRSAGLLYLLGETHASYCIQDEAAPIERAQAESLNYLAVDVAEMITKTSAAAWDEIIALRKHTSDGPPVDPACIHAGKAEQMASVQLARVLELTSDQARALALIAEWEGQTVENYARRVLLAVMFSSFEDMGQLAKDGRTAAERAWAKRFYPQVSALMPKEGWES